MNVVKENNQSSNNVKKSNTITTLFKSQFIDSDSIIDPLCGSDSNENSSKNNNTSSNIKQPSPTNYYKA